MFVALTAVDPHPFMVVTVMIAVVIALAIAALAIAVPGRCDHATRTQNGKSQKKAADYSSFCVIHGMS